MENMITKVRKRDGGVTDFDQSNIEEALHKALTASGEGDGPESKRITERVVELLNIRFKSEEIPSVEQIQDIVEEVLILEDLVSTAKSFILYREQRRKIREVAQGFDSSVEMMDDYLKELDWQVKENANMAYSLQGLNHYAASKITKKYWLNKVYPKEVREAVERGDFHIHDTDVLATYCCGWDLYDLLLKGFGGVKGKLETKPAKHLKTALGQVVNFFYTLQGEAAGAQAFSSFDTLLAPFIRYDNLSYTQVKQAMQEFMFNCAVPTRVGFQCVSEDTEILGKDGWKTHKELKEGDNIATFNIEKGTIEYLPVQRIFSRKYEGKMFNLKNRISDQLISPEHRVLRKRFNSDNYALEKIEKVMELKSPFIVPVGSEGYIGGDESINEDIIKLIAWVISEGTFDKGERGTGRVSIYQSKIKNFSKYSEILSICDSLKLKYTERIQEGIGEECNVIRFDANSTRKILGYFNSDIKKGINFVPENIINSGTETARIFLETYIKGDGIEGCKIATVSKEIKDSLLQVIANAGYGATVRLRKPVGSISKKDLYIIRLIKHKDTYINTVKKVNYKGIIWCPSTINETFVARRNGKIFITGNCPFTNVTLDIKPSPSLAKQPIIIGGKPQDETYGEFQEEMNMFNKAFYEVLMAGDAVGRPFTFPIPTVNITKDFKWDNPNLDILWEATAKYGANYFSNFVNSDMNPEDVRSMCLYPEEDILIKESGEIKKTTIGELFNSYKGERLDKEWFSLSKQIQSLSLNPGTGKLEWINISKLLEIKDDQLITIEAKDGKTMRVSKDHLVGVFTEEGIVKKKAKDITEEDLILVLKDGSRVLNKEQEIDEDLAWFAGLFIADGNYLYDSRYQEKRLRGVQISFNYQEKELIEKTKKVVKKLVDYDMKFILDKRYDNSLRGYVYNSKFAEYLSKEKGVSKYNQLPKWIWSSSIETIKSFLLGFFDGDGYTDGKEIHINDEPLSKELNLLFQLVGISTTYTIKENSQVIRLQHVLGRGSNNDKVIKDKLHNLIPEFMLNKKSIKGEDGKNLYQCYGCKMVGLSTIDRWNISNEKIEWLRNSDFAVTEIKKIYSQDIKEGQLFYDIELDKNHYFVHSDGNITHNCCRLRLDNSELIKRGGGMFGSNPLTGSVGVVTLNLPRLAYLSKTKNEFFERIIKAMDLAKESLEIKRKAIENFADKGLYPYTKHYLSGVKKMRGSYFGNHFSTIGIIGMNEAILNFMGENITTKKGQKFALELMEYMRDVLVKYQEETGNLYNLEATPGEGTSYRLASRDRKEFSDIITAGTDKVPYYTNSSQLPVDHTRDVFEALEKQDKLQCSYTGGTVLHMFIGEKIEDITAVKALVKKSFENYHLPYITITPTFSICPEHGYIAGEHFKCPKCVVEQPCEVYSRVVGYYRPVQQWNKGKSQEYTERKEFECK
jgi:anaerobic ribonucleoside-triphosphate reductase